MNAGPSASIAFTPAKTPSFGSTYCFVTTAANQSVTFAGSATDPEGDTPLVSSYTWKSDTVTFNTGSAGPTRSFATGSSYTIDFTAVEHFSNASFPGRTAASSLTLVVKNPPTPAIRHNKVNDATYPNSGNVVLLTNGTLYFSGTNSAANDPLGGALSGYSWNFGDGNTGSGSTINHQYTAPGTYTATLNVTDQYGSVSTTPAQITVSVYDPPSATISASGGQSVATQTLGTAYMMKDGDSIDFSGASTDPAGGTLTYTWNFGGSATPNTSTSLDPAAYTINTLPGFGWSQYTVTFTAHSSVTGGDGVGTLQVYVKQPPSATLSFTSPSTAPDAYGDAPLAVNVSATVVHNDPFIEGGEDADGNTRDYTFTWTFDAGVTNTTNITGATHTYTTPGTEIVDLDLEDDYGFTGTVYQNVYVTPLAKINFPPARVLPFDQAPVIDGIVEPTDTDGNGSEDVLEVGWNNAFRVTHDNGTDMPVGMQVLRHSISGQNYFLLSFQVTGDAVYDSNDVIVLTFRPDATAVVPANDRRICLFPVWDDAGACDAGGAGGSLSAHRYNKPPRQVLYYSNSGSWTPLTTDITEAAAETDPGFYYRVHSAPNGTTYKWDVEMRIPLTKTAGGTNWLDLAAQFRFYANVIRVTDRAQSFGTAGYAAQFTWPREAPDASGSLDGPTNAYAFPVWQWGSAVSNSTLADAEGVYIENHASIGFWDGSNIVNTINLGTLVPDGSGNVTVPLVAKVQNNSAALVDNVNVLMRVAFWGATLGAGGDWRKVDVANASACPADHATDPATWDHNPTCSLSVPAQSGATPGNRNFRIDWKLDTAGAQYDHLRNVQNHQCMYAEINATSGNVNIIRKSSWNNLIFYPSSTVNDVARISTVGCGRPPAGMKDHRVILEVKKREWKETSWSAGNNRLTALARRDMPVRGTTTSYMEYLVYAYYDNGKSLDINSQKYFLFEPIASFGYVFYHDYDVSRWIGAIEGAKKINDGLYVIDIAPESHKDIGIHVESVESRFSLSLHGGIATPLANFANAYTTGFCAVLDFGYEITPNWSIVLNAGYNHLPGANSSVPAVSLLSLGLDARFTLPFGRLVYGYAQAGPSVYLQDFSAFSAGYSGGLGFGLDLPPRLRLEVGTDYHSTWNQQNWFLQTHLGVVLRL